jgi:hypothetical protein
LLDLLESHYLHLKRLYRLDEIAITINKIRNIIYYEEEVFWKTWGENRDNLNRYREILYKLKEHYDYKLKGFYWKNMRDVFPKKYVG